MPGEVVPKSSDDLVEKLVPILNYNIRKQALSCHWIIIFVIGQISKMETLFNSSLTLKYESLLYFSFQKFVSTIWFIVVSSVQQDILFPNCMIIKIN